MTLTEEGHRFADWITKKGRKCSFFWTPAGGWGTPKVGGSAEKMLEDRQRLAAGPKKLLDQAQKPPLPPDKV